MRRESHLKKAIELISTSGIDLTDVVIKSGEGELGTIERYSGAPNIKAILKKVKEEESGGDRWVFAYAKVVSENIADDTYVQLDKKGNPNWDRMQTFTEDDLGDEEDGDDGEEKYWVIMCGEHYGWGEVYDGLWGYETRIYRTKEAAEKRMEELKDPSVWEENTKSDPDSEYYDPDFDWHDEIPEYYLKQMTEEEILDTGGHGLIDDLNHIGD